MLYDAYQAEMPLERQSCPAQQYPLISSQTLKLPPSYNRLAFVAETSVAGTNWTHEKGLWRPCTTPSVSVIAPAVAVCE